MNRTIHKSHFDGNKSHVLKASLILVDNNKICDGCDERKKCASIHQLGGGVMIICEDCIIGIWESLNSDIIDRNEKINDILNG